MNPKHVFHTYHYLRHNARRMEHLSSLGLALHNKTVLETGAGIGDHSHFFLDRNCQVTITEAREDNLRVLHERYPGERVMALDLESPTEGAIEPHEVVYCYGTLYHINDPVATLNYLADHCTQMLLLESCVSFGDADQVLTVPEPQENVSQAFSGTGSRPTRQQVLQTLQAKFDYVYIPLTQPNHEEFPIDWERPEQHEADLSRAIFVASRTELSNPLLTRQLLSQQTRHN